jgi:uncharacterized protein
MQARDTYRKIWQELSRDKGMVLLSGPRQAGKTTVAKLVAQSFVNSLYFNWDMGEHRARLVKNRHFFEEMERKDTSAPLVILDEIHKCRDWKNYLKDIYDEFHEAYTFLVSGSGRLDIYEQGGDSQAGRCFLFHLFPFTVAELSNRRLTLASFLADPLRVSMDRYQELQEIWKRLAVLSGFPEPYLSGRETTYFRWTETYARQLVREDVRDLSDVRSIQDIETLYMLLPAHVGRPLSVPALAGDLQVSYNAVRAWVDILERFYLIFSVPTWTAKISRAIQKERKVYLWDYPRIKDTAARFENMVAAELWRAVTAWNDGGYGNYSLHFIKNKEKKEVDFLIAREGSPLLLVEAKLMEMEPTKSLRAFQKAINVPAVQLTDSGGEGYRLFSNDDQKIMVCQACQWLAQLP